MESFAEFLASSGLLDPVGIMARISTIFGELGLFNVFRWLALGVFLALAGYRLVVATAQLRAQAFASLILRSLLVGVLVAVSPYLQMATLNLYNTAWSAGLRVGGILFDYNASLTQNYAFITSVGTFAAGAGALAIMGKGAINAGTKALEELGKKEGSAAALGRSVGEGTARGMSKALDYLNIFALILIPLMLLFAIVSVTSGMTVLIGTMLLPVILTFLILNGPGVTVRFLDPFYRAVAGSYLLALMVPIVFGAAAFTAVGIPMQNFNQDWDKTVSALFQTPFWEFGVILSHVGSLIWIVIRTAIQVLVGIILGYYIINKSAETILHFVGGVGGLVRSYAEAFLSGRAGAATVRTMVQAQPVQTAYTGAIGTARLSFWTARTARATAGTAYADARARGLIPGVEPPEPNAYDLRTRTPLYTRPWDRESAYDRVLQWWDQRNNRSLDHRRIPLNAEDNEKG